MSEEKIVIENVSRIYDIGRGNQIVAVDNVSLTISNEEFICIVGPSGCGKSTLLFLAAGLEHLSSGSILVNGKKVSGTNPEVGMVFQPDSVFPWLTVQENVEFGPRMKRLSQQECHNTAESYIEMVGLQGFEHSLPRQLSGGMKKRVDVARALANNPSILLMDEPYGALDALTKEKLQYELLRLLERERKTVMFVTHDLEEALFLGSRIVVMSRAPNTIQTVLDVPFPHPRDLTLKVKPEFQELRLHLWDLLQVEE